MTTSEAFARQIRIEALRMVYRAQASHIGGALSMADILAVCYGPDGILRFDSQRPDWSGRDRFFLSKGHACTGLYAVLALAGFIEYDELETYGQPDCRLMSHASHKVPGVELSTGSLGHALPVAAGLALGLKRQGGDQCCVVVVSDGEMDEGSNWEAILFAAHHQLGRLSLVIDCNGLQGLDEVSTVMCLEPLVDKLTAFGWSVAEVDGHDHEALRAALASQAEDRPLAVVARTVKGKGVSFMEGQMLWHYRSPREEDFAKAMDELGAGHA